MDSKIPALLICLFIVNFFTLAAACTDSDGGNNKFIKGHCSDGTDSFDDECVGDDHIYELVCEEGLCVIVENLACPPDTECVDGACVGPGVPQITSCVDTDNGVDKLNYGECVDDTGTYEDTCVTEDRIKEIYCYNNKCAIEFDDSCPEGTECSGGECVEEAPPVVIPCTDSDGGDNKLVKGSCTDRWKGIMHDACISDTRIFEQICQGDACVSAIVKDCPQDTVCRNGACVQVVQDVDDNGGGQDDGTGNGGQPVTPPADNDQQQVPIDGGASIDPVLLVIIIVIIVVVVSVAVIVLVVVGRKSESNRM